MISPVLFFVCATLQAATPDLRVEVVRESLTGTHVRYRQFVRGLPVAGGEVSVANGRVVGRRIARIDGDLEAPPPFANAAVNVDGVLRFARRVVIEEKPLERIAYYYDVETGDLLRVEPLYYSAAARVFDPNPVVTLNDPALQDRNDAASAVPSAAYRDVEVPAILDGPFVRIIDRELPATTPAAGGVYDRSDDGFEDVNAYFHIDANQRYLQSLGYTGRRSVAAYPVPVDTHAAAGADDSYFIPDLLAERGTGALYFGEGGTDDAEDADLVIHEYGHAIQDWISPGTFTGAFNSEARALGEGFSDYWAFSTHYSRRIASGRDPFCWADWDSRCWEDATSERCAYVPDSNCLRRLDSVKTMGDFSRSPSPGTEHLNGEIWSSALREIFLQLGKRTTDTIVLESLFGTPPNPTYLTMAYRMIVADRLLYNGAHAWPICDAMFRRGIISICGYVPLGELTRTQSVARDLPIPENDSRGVTSTVVIRDERAIAALHVNVDIAHPSRGDLRIELIAPDGTTITLQNPLLDRSIDLRATYGVDAQPVQSLDILRGRSALGTWTLKVSDLSPLDVGTLRSWSLVVQYEGDTRSDERPAGFSRQTIPVVGSVYGVGATRFVSDVRLVNPSPFGDEVATLVFTRGTGEFAVVKASVGPLQTIALDDVVAQTFYTSGIGQLEIIGNVVASSRAYTGNAGQSVRAFTSDDATGVGETALRLQQLARDGERSNVGVAEVAGGEGVVRIGSTEYPIVPFGHLQIATRDASEVAVVSGTARVVAYASTISNTNDDPVFIPAVRPSSNFLRQLHAPVINTPEWRTEAWIDDNPPIPYPAVGLTVWTMQVPPGHLASARIVHGGYRQFVPPAVAREGTLDATGIENNARFRTNIGVIAETKIVARVVVLDAAGVEVMRREVTLFGGGIEQFRVDVPVTNGSAFVEVVSGRAVAYASVIDNESGDASFVQFAVR